MHLTLFIEVENYYSWKNPNEYNYGFDATQFWSRLYYHYFYLCKNILVKVSRVLSLDNLGDIVITDTFMH